MKSKYGFFGAVALSIIISFLPLPRELKLIGIFAITFGIIYVNRSLFYFIQGNRHYMNKKKEDKSKTWDYYRKAYETGLVDKYKITMASILIQKNDHNFGGEILDSIISNARDETLVKRAIIAKSMVYQINGDVDKSIEILEDVKDGGYSDIYLMINLQTYVLYQNDLKKAKELIKETLDEKKTVIGIADNHGWYYILTGQWEKAYHIYIDVIERKPHSPDPYVHAAQVYLHYNNKEKAIELLKEASNKTWYNTIIFDRDIINSFVKDLESENSDYVIACINESSLEVARGERYKELSSKDAKAIMSKPFDNEPIVEETTTEVATEEQVVDDELPNTDLTEEDLKWAEENE